MPSLAQRLADPWLQGRVKPITLQRYKAALLHFTTWATAQQLLPVTADDWDDALLEYRFSTTHLTKSKFAMVVAALEFFLPQHRQKLPWCRAVLVGWGRKGHTRHTVPLTEKPALLVAIKFVTFGRVRLGAGLILQVSTGLRPSEMLNIKAEHVLLPEDSGQDPSKTPIVIALGVVSNTKSKRPQVVTVPPTSKRLCALIRQCRSKTPPGYFLFPHTLAEYRLQLKKAERELGLSLGWGPHSPRAGWATDQKVAGTDFVTIREGGRWLSDASLRCYLDILSATMAIRTLRDSGLAPQVEAASRLWPYYFGLPVDC